MGLTGSPQQRLQQLEEAWLHMARHPATAVPAYKAVQVSGRAAAACLLYACRPVVRLPLWGLHPCASPVHQCL